ncbi:serine hydrolase [Novacetimonas hansenii]|nr:serine hydrolase [Novacetimonas hansenii]
MAGGLASVLHERPAHPPGRFTEGKVMSGIFAMLRRGVMTATVGLVCAAAPVQAATLAQDVAKTVSGQPGSFAVYAAMSGQRPQVCLNCTDYINAASTMKLFVMDAAYDMFTRGTLQPQETIVVHNRFHSLVGTRSFSLEQKEDSYDPLYAQIGRPVTVSELVRVMIQYSSNLATNLMVERIGVPYIHAVMHAQHLKGVRFGRMIEDYDANDKGIRNEMTAKGLGMFMQKLDQGKIIGPAQSAAMIDILRGQTFNDMIPPGLPPGTPVAHKTGWVDGVRNDAGIVFLPDGRHYILVMLTKSLPDEAAGIRVLNGISRQVYGHFVASPAMGAPKGG